MPTRVAQPAPRPSRPTGRRSSFARLRTTSRQTRGILRESSISRQQLRYPCTDSRKGTAMPTILDRIVETKLREIVAAKAAVPEAELERRIADLPPTRDFRAAIKRF